MGCIKLEILDQVRDSERAKPKLFLEVCQRKRVCAEKKGVSSYRFGFNGMEADNEIAGNGNSYSTFERPYDARIGRWFKTDVMESEAPMWSPYRFGFDNPILFSDSEGSFEIDEATKKAYPKLDAYLKNLANEYASKPEEFKKAFKRWGDLTDKQVADMLEYGKGPTISVANLDRDTDGDGVEDRLINGITNRGPENPGTDINSEENGPFHTNIVLDDDILASFNMDTDSEGNGEGKTLLESTVFHEATHYGDNKDGEKTRIKGKVMETGKQFEKKVYGNDVSRGNYRETHRSYNKMLTKKADSADKEIRFKAHKVRDSKTYKF